MRSKVQEKEEAIKLRRKGYSYNEILKKISVAKSTLSLWLKDLPLTEDEKNYVRERVGDNLSRGRLKAASELRKRRTYREQVAAQEAKSMFESNCEDSIFLLGVMLYWAEGSSKHPVFQFTNSNPTLVLFMFRWIKQYLLTEPRRVRPRIYAHKLYSGEDLVHYWSHHLDIPEEDFYRTVYKPTTRTYKKNPNYKGCVRLDVGGVENYRKMMTWKKCLGKYILQDT